jgi:hypothetical protein
MESQRWLSVLTSQLGNLPYAFAFAIGILLAIVFCRRHPFVSLFATCGFAILLVNLLLGVGLNIWIVGSQGSFAQDRANWMAVFSAARAMLAFVGYMFLIAAIFGWRDSGQGHVGLAPGKAPGPARPDSYPAGKAGQV